VAISKVVRVVAVVMVPFLGWKVNAKVKMDDGRERGRFLFVCVKGLRRVLLRSLIGV